MKLISISTWLLALLPALFSFVGNTDDDKFTFYLYSNRIFAPQDNDIAVFFNGQGRQRVTLQLTAYRIKDPVAFFMAQDNPHSPGTVDTAAGGATHIDTRNGKMFTKVTEWQHDVKSRDRYWYQDQVPVP